MGWNAHIYKHKFETHQVFSLKFDDREVSSFQCAKSAPVDFYDCQGNRIRNSANKATVKKSMVTYVERAGGIKLRHETSAFTVKPRGLRFRCKFSAPLSAQPSQQQAAHVQKRVFTQHKHRLLSAIRRVGAPHSVLLSTKLVSRSSSDTLETLCFQSYVLFEQYFKVPNKCVDRKFEITCTFRQRQKSICLVRYYIHWYKAVHEYA